MRTILLASVLATACNSRPTCPAGDLDCLARAFSINDFATFDDDTKRDPLTAIANALPVGTSPQLTLSEVGALNFASVSDGALILLTWTDANGCRPGLCVSHCPRGVQCGSGARCTPSRQDGLTRATTQHWIQYGADPEVTTDVDVVITPVSATGCPTDVATLINAADPSVAIGPAVVIPLHLPAPGGGGGGDTTCPDGLHASTLSCTPLGAGGVGDTCVTNAEYQSIFGTNAPTSCAPVGTQHCLDTQKGALVAPCCPGLSCNVGSACGGGSVVGGVCQ
ncbi:MAG: hypothetical protein ABI591_10725 [Kofleriaceae bacterium]